MQRNLLIANFARRASDNPEIGSWRTAIDQNLPVSRLLRLDGLLPIMGRVLKGWNTIMGGPRHALHWERGCLPLFNLFRAFILPSVIQFHPSIQCQYPPRIKYKCANTAAHWIVWVRRGVKEGSKGLTKGVAIDYQKGKLFQSRLPSFSEGTQVLSIKSMYMNWIAFSLFTSVGPFLRKVDWSWVDYLIKGYEALNQYPLKHMCI